MLSPAVSKEAKSPTHSTISKITSEINNTSNSKRLPGVSYTDFFLLLHSVLMVIDIHGNEPLVAKMDVIKR